MKTVSLISFFLWFFFPKTLFADWPMPGHDNQRTSRAEDTTPSTFNQGCGRHEFPDYIPSKAHLITVDRGPTNSMIYIPTAKGIYALKDANLTNTESDIVWFYPTAMPVGHSPTADKATDTMFIPVLDKTIHVINALTGEFIWKTDKAGGGFLSNPLIANNKIYAGNRDGYIYAFDIPERRLAWHFKTEGPVDFSPAISADNQILYIGSKDSRAYALNANDGTLIKRTEPFMGSGFYSFWPVVHTSANRVLFPHSLNYPENYVDGNQAAGVLPETPEDHSISSFINWLTTYPEQKTLFILDPQTLEERETAPYLWRGNPTGNRYPPIIDTDGTIWALAPFHASAAVGFPQGRFLGWKIGENTFIPKPGWSSGTESHDEPAAISMFGNAIWHGHGGDGADIGGYASISSGTAKTWDSRYLFESVGVYWSFWGNFHYGNGLVMGTNPWPSITGTHGNQNPPVPLRGKAYIHRSNAVICVQP